MAHANKIGLVRDKDGKVKIDTREQLNIFLSLSEKYVLEIDGKEYVVSEYIKEQNELGNVRILEEE
mgnify:CR=1 FL=1